MHEQVVPNVVDDGVDLAESAKLCALDGRRLGLLAYLLRQTSDRVALYVAGEVLVPHIGREALALLVRQRHGWFNDLV